MIKNIVLLILVSGISLTTNQAFAADKLHQAIELHINKAVQQSMGEEAEIISAEKITELKRLDSQLFSNKVHDVLGYFKCKLKMKTSSTDSSLPRSKSFGFQYDYGSVIDAFVYFSAKVNEDTNSYKTNAIRILGVNPMNNLDKKTFSAGVNEMKKFAKNQYCKEVNDMYDVDTYKITPN